MKQLCIMHYALVTYVGWQARTAQLEKRIKISFTFATYLTYPTPNGAECTPDLAMAMRTVRQQRNLAVFGYAWANRAHLSGRGGDQGPPTVTATNRSTPWAQPCPFLCASCCQDGRPECALCKSGQRKMHPKTGTTMAQEQGSASPLRPGKPPRP